MSKLLTICSTKQKNIQSLLNFVCDLRMKKLNLYLIVATAFSLNAYGKDIDCPTNVAEINNGEWCDAYSAEQHQKVVDKQLNTVYRSFIKNQPENVKKRWVLAQKYWINYRDAHCSAVEGYRPSSSSTARSVLESCLSEETEKRIQILRDYCEESGCK